LSVASAVTVNLGLRLFADWLAERTGQPVSLTAGDTVPETAALIAHGEVGSARLAAALCFIVPPEGDGAWYRAKESLSRRIRARVEGGCLIWVPQGVDLPEREPRTSEIVLGAEEALGRFVPGGHGEIRFPIQIAIRKSDAEGSYVTARGGLAPFWAQFTNRVNGHFQLDSTELHRLPAGEAHLSGRIDRIVEAANALELGHTAEVSAEDAWVAQRLRGGEGVALLGEPPGSELSSGAGLRRSLRRTVQALRGPLLEVEADAHIIALVGPYTSIEQQPVATALLGFDPALYQGIDLICLAAEGMVKPLLDLTRSPLLRAAASA
jgi:hypothetical protein